MSDHLPECYWPELPERAICICDRLRACEQRVLQAAREAVAALEPLLDRSKHEGGYDCCGCATVGYVWTDALDAIDALSDTMRPDAATQ